MGCLVSVLLVMYLPAMDEKNALNILANLESVIVSPLSMRDTGECLVYFGVGLLNTARVIWGHPFLSMAA